MALLDSKQLNPRLTGSFTLSGSIVGDSTSTGSFSYLNVDGDAVISGNLTFGNADTDSVSFGAEISSSLVPDVSDAYNIGSDSKRWNDFYLSGSISASGGPHHITSATTIDLDAEGALTLDGGSITIGGDTDVAVDIDSTTLDIDASDAVTIDSTSTILISGDGGATFSDDTEALVYDGSGNVDFDTVALDIDSSGAITIDGTSTLSIDVDGTTNINTSVGNIGIDSEAGSITIDGHTGVEVTSTNSGVVTIDGKTGVTIQEDGTDVIAIDTNRDVLFSQTGGSTSDPDVEFDGYTRFDGTTEITDSTNSTSTSTGALIIDGGVGIAKDVIIGGSLTAQEFHTEFVSASIVFTSGSTKFGDSLDDIHNFTGSINQSGSAVSLTTTTGAITLDGKTGVTIKESGTNVIAIDTNRDVLFSHTGGSTSDPDVEFDGYTRFDGVAEVSLGTESTSTSTGALIVDGGVGVVKNVNVGGNISGSYTSTGSFGTLRVVDPAGINIDSIGTVSGSFTSTGSFSRLEIAKTGSFGRVITTTADINGGTIDGITSLTAGGDLDIGAHDLRAATLTADGLTSGRVVFAGTDGVLSDDSDLTFSGATLSSTNITTTGTIKDFALVSGSSVSTGSFGRLEIVGNANVDGDITLGGDISIGDATGDSVSFGAEISSSLIPDADSTYDIGSSSKNWRFGYIEQVSATHVTASGNISGSHTSTGSFGEVSVDGMSVSSLTTFSSSVATKLDTLDADIIALSIALG